MHDDPTLPPTPSDASRDRNNRRGRFAAAVIDRATGQMRRVEPVRPPAPLPLSALQQALEGLDFFALDGDQTLSEYVRLSPRTPWTADRGWLEALNVRGFFAGSPNMHWIPEQGQPQGYLDIWLDGLEPDATYIAQIEVSSLGTGVFEVQAVTLGGGVFVANTEANGGSQTLICMFGTGASGGLGKIKVSNPDWVFFEAVISKLE